MKKAYVMYGTPSKETICELLEFQKENRGRRGQKAYLQIMAKNFPNIKRDLDIPVHEAHGLPNKLSLKISSSRHIIIKLSKIKENLKSSKVKEV